MQCAYCGTEVPAGQAFCGACGAAVTDPGAATVAIATAEQAKDPLLVELRRDLSGEYEVERVLGRGGMAVVYKATEVELQRVVALKVLPPGTGGPTMAERFKREARMAAALDHPNIIPVYRVGQAAGTYYFAMKFVEGRAVDAILEQQGALPVPVVLAILRGAAAGLAFGHERGIVHRDIKGANVLIDRDGRVLVADFGIARAMEEKTLTASGAVMGTPHFMSPEQCSGKRVGPQSDQYALGVLAFQMLAGAVPFDADSLMAILHHHYVTPPPDLRAVRPGVPEPLLAIVYRALAKDADQRWATTRDLLADLEAVPLGDAERRQAEETLRQLAVGVAVPQVRTSSLPPLADTRVAGTAAGPTVTTTPRRAPPPWRRRAPLIGAVLAVAALGTAGTLVVRQRQQATREAVARAVADSTHRADSLRADSLRLASAARPPAPDSASPTASDSAAGRARTPAPRTPPRLAPTQAALPPAQVAARPPPAAPAGGPAFLSVRTVPPNADVLLDGRFVAQGGGIGLQMRAGTHRLKIRAAGYVDFDTTFTVEEGATVNLRTRTLREVSP